MKFKLFKSIYPSMSDLWVPCKHRYTAVERLLHWERDCTIICLKCFCPRFKVYICIGFVILPSLSFGPYDFPFTTISVTAVFWVNLSSATASVRIAAHWDSVTLFYGLRIQLLQISGALPEVWFSLPGMSDCLVWPVRVHLVVALVSARKNARSRDYTLKFTGRVLGCCTWKPRRRRFQWYLTTITVGGRPAIGNISMICRPSPSLGALP